jgi:glyoxylase-like metal-dependent hydrolase (beta-lactamase superfamily II)
VSTEDTAEAQRLARYDVVRLRAENPGLLTLTGTNTWIVGRDPAWVIDPGPALAEHLDSLVELIGQRGGLGGIALTHDHHDHSEAVPLLRERLPASLAAGRGEADVRFHDGSGFGPLEAAHTPGHASDHYALIAGPICFTGDAVLGEGSVFIAPEPGALAGYLAGLERLRDRALEVLCPGHGPAIWDPKAKLDEYIEHRLERERKLLEGLTAGRRSVAELLDVAWSDVPEQMRGVAAVTLVAHLDKLEQEGLLPEDVERPSW